MQGLPPELRACRRCRAPLVPERVSWAKDGVGAAWACSQCGAVRFEVAAERPASTDVVREDEGGEGGYRADARRRGQVAMVRRWRRPIHVVLLIVSLLYFFVPIVGAILGHPELLSLFVSAYYATFAMAVAAYVSVCGLVNRTHLELHDGLLKITHGPLPLKKDKTVPARELTDVWTQHVRIQNGPDVYRLRVAYQDGAELVLLDELPSAEDGVFLEQKIAAHLGLSGRGG